MIFTLEALQAGKGDSLILHYGKPDSPRFIVIDGGPAGIYDGFLRPRLEKLHKKWKRDDDKLHLDMLMVSHIDDDHINGVIEWMKEIEAGREVPCNISTLWYNSFDGVLGNAANELKSRVASAADATLEEAGESHGMTRMAAAVIASVKQGRILRERADALGIPLNGGFKGLVMADDSGKATITRGSGLKLHVIGPSLARLRALQEDWDKHVRANPDPVVAASFADRSVANLSSIVVVAELQGQRMLLTGDARGDDILKGLEAGGFLDANGAAHFSVLKMPHHGSNRNMTKGWLEKITADHYVISANGEHGNPDVDTITWICEARGDDRYAIHMTNEEMVDPKDGRDIGKLVKKELKALPGAGRKVVFRDAGASIRVDLLDRVDY